MSDSDRKQLEEQEKRYQRNAGRVLAGVIFVLIVWGSFPVTKLWGDDWALEWSSLPPSLEPIVELQVIGAKGVAG